MTIRALLATGNPEFLQMMNDVLDAALQLVFLDVRLETVGDRDHLLGRMAANLDDVVFLDWDIVHGRTPDLVREILRVNPRMRIVAMLPQTHRSYRQKVWEAGACNGIPKEHVDQEWLATVLCIMTRAMERERRLLQVSGKESIDG